MNERIVYKTIATFLRFIYNSRCQWHGTDFDYTAVFWREIPFVITNRCTEREMITRPNVMTFIEFVLFLQTNLLERFQLLHVDLHKAYYIVPLVKLWKKPV